MILKGVPSGDLECWCFLVDKKTFIEVKGKEPEEWDVAPRAKAPYRYRLYPGEIFDEHDRGLKGKVVILAVDMEIA